MIRGVVGNNKVIKLASGFFRLVLASVIVLIRFFPFPVYMLS